MSKRTGLLFLILALLLLPNSARARHGGAGRASAAKQKAQAQKLLDQGIAALVSRDFQTAAQSISDSYRVRVSAEALFYLGALAQAENRILDAQDLMRRYLADPELDAAADSEQKEAQRILTLPRPAHGKLSIVGDAGTIISVDGRLVGSLPISRSLLVAPGQRTVTLEWNGQKQEEQVKVPESRFVELRHNAESRAVVVSELPGVLLLANFKDVAAEEQKQLQQATEQAVQGEHYTMVSREQALDAVRDPELFKCLDQAACQARLAERSGVDFVLLLSAQRREKDLRLEFQILDASIGELAVTAEKSCENCDKAQAAAALTASLPPLLLQSKNRPRGSIEVTSQPAGAEVRAGGRLLGRTPLVQRLWAGPQDLELSVSNYVSQHEQLTVKEGETTKLEVHLQPVATVRVVTVRETERRFPRALHLGLSGAAAGVGVLMLGFGISGLAQNGACSVPPLTKDGLCLEVFHTGAVGGTLTAFGSVLMVGGALLIAIPELYRARKDKAYATKPTASVSFGSRL